jgi:hypothetical protein
MDAETCNQRMNEARLGDSLAGGLIRSWARVRPFGQSGDDADGSLLLYWTDDDLEYTHILNNTL